jgi:hypothetical protein
MAKDSKYTIDWLLHNYMPFFSEFGMQEDNIRSHFIEWSQDRPPLVKDFLWYIFQKLLQAVAVQATSEHQLYSLQREIYSKMLEFRKKEEKSKAKEIMRLFMEAELMKTKTDENRNIELKVTFISKHCCEFCASFDNQIVSIDEALKNMFIGSDKCTNPKGCNCTVSYIPVRDSNGRVVRRKR